MTRTESPAAAPAAAVTGPSTDPLGRGALAVIAAVALVVSFVQSPGRIIDDTKLPVVMAPWTWMRQAVHLWDPGQASGSVQVEKFGYLFPMAPFFAVTHLLHIPDWMAERLWLALLLTVGMWGMIRLAEALGIGRRWARVLGATAYCIAPIVVDWAAISVALLAVVFLPWMLRPLVVGAREGSPRRAAATSGVAIALMGGVNATVVLAGVPLGVLWLFTRSPGPRRRALAGWWALAVVLACFWWVFGTVLQGKYGYNYLPYTESAVVTTSKASMFTALTGTSNWQNFDNLNGPLVPGGWTLVSNWVVVVATAVIAGLGLAGLARRIPERLFLVGCLAFGAVAVCIGYGGSLGGFFSSHVISLLSGPLGPLRNVSKFSPDLTLPLSLGLAWLVSEAVTGSRERRRGNSARGRTALVVLAVAAVVVAAAPFWQAQLYPPGGFSSFPSYWQQTAGWLDQHQGNQTSLLVPGSPFADYTWGKPQDEPLTVLTSKSVTARDIIPLGSDPNTLMLSAVEQALTTGSPQPGMAQYLAREGIQYVIERNDLDLKTSGAPPPALVHQVLHETPGLQEVASFGPYLPASQVAQGNLPVYDDPSSTHLRPVEIYRVDPSPGEVQTYPEADPVVLDGSDTTAMPLAETDAATSRAIVFAKDIPAANDHPSAGTTWVLSDGNQRRAVTFGLINNNLSYLLAPGQKPTGTAAHTPLSYGSLGVPAAQTVAAPIGAAVVDASTYGSTTYLPEPAEGPASAFDGDPTTAWVASSREGSIHQWVSITFSKPISLRRIAIAPLDDGPARPTISSIDVATDGGTVTRSLPVTNQPVLIAVHPGSTLHLVVTIADSRPATVHTFPLEGAGIRDIVIPGVTFRPAMMLPTDQTAALSGSSGAAPTLLFYEPVQNPNLDFSIIPVGTRVPARQFTLPKALMASVTGSATPLPSRQLDTIIGAVGPSPAVQVSATSWLAQLPRFRPQNLVDTATTPWIAGLEDPNPSVHLQWQGEDAVSSLFVGLTPYASRPTEMTVSSPTQSVQVRVPPAGGVVTFPAMMTDQLTVRFTAVQQRRGLLPSGPLIEGFQAPKPVVLPVGLSALGVPDLKIERIPAPGSAQPVALACGSGPDLDLNGTVVRTALTGTVGDLLDLRPMAMQACPSSHVSLPAGANVVTFPPDPAFRVSGVLMRPTSSSPAASPRPRPATVQQWSTDQRTVHLGPGPATFLAMAQNYNKGWVATLDGKTLHPVLLDGWQQGWEIPAGSAAMVSVRFAPQREFLLGLGVGLLFLLVLLVLALWPGSSAFPPVGRRRTPREWVLMTLTVGVLLCVGGLLAVLVVPAFYAVRRWGDRGAAAAAIVAMVVAGFLVGWNTHFAVLGIGITTNAFGPLAQLFAVAALTVVFVVTAEGSRRTAPRVGGGDHQPRG